jgi:hypothetical protein
MVKKTRKQQREEDEIDFLFLLFFLVADDKQRNDFIEITTRTGKMLEDTMKALMGKESANE